MKKAMLIILIISLSLGSLLIAVEQESFNLSNYLTNYMENNIAEKTGENSGKLIEITVGLIDYIKNHVGNEALRPHFNEREILHMEDVQVLFKYGSIIKNMSIIISLGIIIFFLIRKEIQLLGKYIFKGMFINWIIIGLLLIMIFSNFNRYFTYFHLIFFRNDLWLLDPKTDLMIQMLPESFFINMAKKIGILFAFYIVAIQGLAYSMLRIRKKEDDQDLLNRDIKV